MDFYKGYTETITCKYCCSIRYQNQYHNSYLKDITMLDIYRNQGSIAPTPHPTYAQGQRTPRRCHMSQQAIWLSHDKAAFACFVCLFLNILISYNRMDVGMQQSQVKVGDQQLLKVNNEGNILTLHAIFTTFFFVILVSFGYNVRTKQDATCPYLPKLSFPVQQYHLQPGRTLRILHSPTMSN